MVHASVGNTVTVGKPQINSPIIRLQYLNSSSTGEDSTVPQEKQIKLHNFKKKSPLDNRVISQMFILPSDDKCQEQWHLISQDSFSHFEFSFSVSVVLWLPLPTQEKGCLRWSAQKRASEQAKIRVTAGQKSHFYVHLFQRKRRPSIFKINTSCRHMQHWQHVMTWVRRVQE